jgi:hypothetical protein
MSRIDREDLRKLVREALKEALGPGAGAVAVAKAASEPVPPAPGGGELQRLIRKAVADGRRAEINVAMRTRDDLDRFARDIAEMSVEPTLRAAVLSGTVRFQPVDGPSKPEPVRAGVPAAAPKGGAFEMSSGVLSETKIVEIARSHRKIVVGANVVLTPLARDKARELKVELTRQKP